LLICCTPDANQKSAINRPTRYRVVVLTSLRLYAISLAQFGAVR
jgi:hypothetical protein